MKVEYFLIYVDVFKDSAVSSGIVNNMIVMQDIISIGLEYLTVIFVSYFYMILLVSELRCVLRPLASA